MTYIFDMDGTLIDSMSTYGGAIIKYLDSLNISYPADIIKTVTPLGYLGTAKYLTQNLKIEKSVEEIIDTLGALMLDSYINDIDAKPNVRNTLEKLKNDGHTLAVLTASPHLTLDPCLKRLSLTPLFAKVWSSDDFDTTKADPKIYIEAAKRLGVTVKDCIFLDDNVNAIRAAKEAGMTVYGVYDDSSEAFESEMRLISDKYIKDFTELV